MLTKCSREVITVMSAEGSHGLTLLCVLEMVLNCYIHIVILIARVHMSFSVIIYTSLTGSLRKVYAVFDRDQRALAFMVLLFVTGIITTLLILYLNIPAGEIIIVGPHANDVSLNFPAWQPPIRGLTGCFYVDRPPRYFLAWVPGLIGETILFLMMIFRGWRTYKMAIPSPILNFIIRDRWVTLPLRDCNGADEMTQYLLLLHVSGQSNGLRLGLMKGTNRIIAVLLVNCLIWAMTPQTFDVEVAGGCVLRSMIQHLQ